MMVINMCILTLKIKSECYCSKGARLPDRVYKKAKRLSLKLSTGRYVYRQLRGKRLKRNRGKISFAITRKYRLVVDEKRLSSGPYYCMSHASYDHWLTKI